MSWVAETVSVRQRFVGARWFRRLLVLAPNGDSYIQITAMTITTAPILLLRSKSHGWHDLGVQVQGGGIIKGYEARLSFDGHSYPENPTVPPARAIRGKLVGRELISPTDEGSLLF